TATGCTSSSTSSAAGRASTARTTAPSPERRSPRAAVLRAVGAADDEAAVGQRLQRVLERAEVAAQQQVDRAPVGTARAQPALQRREADALGGLRGQRQQQRELGLVLQRAAEDLQRV